ncbi:hypothetical protein BURPS1655_D0659 [Burkholderia pseudomallei 1655]|nr:hypothetical protein BURPS1655_D0659 [Burkholderia pseudomallei 1655]
MPTPSISARTSALRFPSGVAQANASLDEAPGNAARITAAALANAAAHRAALRARPSMRKQYAGCTQASPMFRIRERSKTRK